MADAAGIRTRTCIGCGKRADKRSLVRIVRTPAGVVRLDAMGNEAGRGAYVCSSDCFKAASEKGKLARALKCGIDRERTAQVAEELEAALADACAR